MPRPDPCRRHAVAPFEGLSGDQLGRPVRRLEMHFREMATEIPDVTARLPQLFDGRGPRQAAAHPSV